MKRLLALGLAAVIAAPAGAQEDLVSASRMIDMPVIDATGKTIGRIVNFAMDPDHQRFDAAVVEAPGLGEAAPSHLVIPWQDITLTADHIRVPVGDSDAQTYAPFQPDPVIAADERPDSQLGWRLSNLVGNYAVLRGGVGYGEVQDVLVDVGTGALSTLVVQPAGRFGTGEPAAYPFVAEAWTPETGTYALPHTADEIAGAPE
ncbi:MAG: hypothetical protein VR70_00085 [Rhodospirillaceae bacterium BRH_c57]|nr:MAG: hypothetical protein VR70_00085 [Rhodospirillaceae bacterium BRH_c57]